MDANKGYYSLIQFCPDLSRLEAATIGVLLFCPDLRFLKARTSRTNDRVKQFFGKDGPLDLAQITTFKRGIEVRVETEKDEIRTLADLQGFIDRRANVIQISNPRPVKVAGDPESVLDRLFSEIIEIESDFIEVPSVQTMGLRQQLNHAFEVAGLEKKIKTGIKVHVPVLEKQVTIPFGFQNGRFNLITPVPFESSLNNAVTTACKYAVEGQSLYDHPDESLGKLQLVVVGKFRQAADESSTVERVERVLNEYSVRLFKFSAIDELVKEIAVTGKAIDA